MVTNVITEEDMNYLVQQSSNNLNMILAGMTTLMEENNNMVYLLENQNWFQRMSKTILGKNKMTQAEIEQNHDKINLYISQAMGELFSRNCIDHEIILGLGNKINELYDSQIQIKMMIGAFAQKLNQKIESIDNFHMLVAEINQGVYDSAYPFFSISKIMSQLDLRTVQDNRKMDILVRALEEHGILNQQEILFSEMLESLLSLDENEAGILAMFFGSIKNEYIAELAEQAIYSYYTLPEKTRKMKSKRSVIESILKSNDIALDYAISSHEMCMTLIDAYTNNIVEIAIEEKKNEVEEKKQHIQDYADNSMKLLKLLKDMTGTWDAKNGEMNTHESRKEYSAFMMKVIDSLNENAYIGNSIMNSLNNMTFFAQKIFLEYPDIRVEQVEDKEACNSILEEVFGVGLEDMEIADSSIKVNANVALETLSEDNEFQTVGEYFKSFLSNVFERPETFSLEYLDNAMEEFPDETGYSVYGMLNVSMVYYVTLYDTIFEKIKNKLNDIDFIGELDNLIQRFPVEYNETYKDVFVRGYNAQNSGPHIELECSSSGSKAGKLDLGWFEDYETKVVLLKFKNMKLKNYTAHYEIIENSYIDTSTWKSYEYVDVEWGDWVDTNTLELKITKNNSLGLGGSFKIKITVAEDPSIMAFIC